jgi:hypothetical protein
MLLLTIRVFALTPTGLGTDCIYNGFTLLCVNNVSHAAHCFEV